MTLLDRLAETEYALFDAPGRSVPTPFGTFVHHPEFPMRYTCNQLIRARCDPGRAAEFFEDLERRYADLNLAFRFVSGHDPASLTVLRPALPSGWSSKEGWMLVWDGEPSLGSNPAVSIREVPPDDPDLVGLHTKPDGTPDHGLRYYVSQLARTGGTWIVAYLDGEPAGSTGWFTVGGVARFRFVGTVERFRRRGVASSMIRYVREHPEVRAQEHLTIMCHDPAVFSLYRRLGFREAGMFWELSLNAPY